MKVWTGKHIGVALGVRDWRQVSTPLRRKHAGLEEMWLEQELDTVDSAQAGHSHRVDFLRYGVTDQASTGLAEDYIGPFFTTSVLWHNVLHLVPGKCCYMTCFCAYSQTCAGGQRLQLQQATRNNYVPPSIRTQVSESKQEELELIAAAVVEIIEPRLVAMEKKLDQVATGQDLQHAVTQIRQLFTLGQPNPAATHPVASTSTATVSVPAASFNDGRWL